MFGWLLGKGKPHQAEKSSKSSAAHGSVQADAGDLGFAAGRSDGATVKVALAEAADRAMEQRREQRKIDRMGRREALFGVVREVMLRSGILSSAYKFKVLSIDQKGRHFLVLLDLSMELADTEPAGRLLEIEQMIADTAMSRMQVAVQAVYWRHFVPGQAASVHLSTGDTQPGGLSASIGMGSDSAMAEHKLPAHKTEVKAEAKVVENSAADAISTALAEMRAKNRAKSKEQTLATTAQGVDAAAGFAATQIIQRSQLGASSVDTQAFPETQMHIRMGQAADHDELEAFQLALRGKHAAAEQHDDDPASIFVSGKALDGHRDFDEMDEHFSRGGVDLSGTQYGELPKF